jgi:hypothetical protein
MNDFAMYELAKIDLADLRNETAASRRKPLRPKGIRQIRIPRRISGRPAPAGC